MQIQAQYPKSIPNATTHLLTTAKTLFHCLTSWSQGEIDVKTVSNNFVHFGDAFKTLKKAYSLAGVDISTIPDTPGRIRSILETSLVMEPSKESLEKFLPDIGASVRELMTMLKDKQAEIQNNENKQKPRSSSISSATLSSPLSNSSFNILKPPDQGSLPSLQFKNKSLSKDPLSQLQNNNDLKRRASKRFSAYQTSSILSMQSRNDASFDSSIISISPQKAATITAKDLEMAKNTKNIESIDEEEELKNEDVMPLDNRSNTLDDNITIGNTTSVGATVMQNTINALSGKNITLRESSSKEHNTIFIKLKDEVKKVEIKLPTTITDLKLLFKRKFDYTPPGASPFPPFYIQDPNSNVSYELEDETSIEYGSVVSLKQPNIETALFQQLDDQMNNMKSEIMDMENRLFKRLDEIQNTQKISHPNTPSFISSSTIKKNIDEDKFEEKMQKKLATNSKNQKLIDELRDEIKRVKNHQARSKKSIINLVGDTIKSISQIENEGLVLSSMTENAYVSQCRKKVSSGCEMLVQKLDDIQDVIDFMKIDITKHSIKPSQKQLDRLAREMANTKIDLQNLTEYTRLEKKNLVSVWNKQMSTIASDQKFFKAQDEIMGFLSQDYESAQETYELILSCVDQLDKRSNASKSKLLVTDPTISPLDASRLVMAEVNAIIPNHEERVGAIEKAERVREMEKELRLKNEFQEELGAFVDNDKLKKSGGGITEIERIRQEKDQEHFKNTLGVI